MIVRGAAYAPALGSAAFGSDFAWRFFVSAAARPWNAPRSPPATRMSGTILIFSRASSLLMLTSAVGIWPRALTCAAD